MTGDSLSVLETLNDEVDLKHHRHRVNTLGNAVLRSQTRVSEIMTTALNVIMPELPTHAYE